MALGVRRVHELGEAKPLFADGSWPAGIMPFVTCCAISAGVCFARWNAFRGRT